MPYAAPRVPIRPELNAVLRLIERGQGDALDDLLYPSDDLYPGDDVFSEA